MSVRISPGPREEDIETFPVDSAQLLSDKIQIDHSIVKSNSVVNGLNGHSGGTVAHDTGRRVQFLEPEARVHFLENMHYSPSSNRVSFNGSAYESQRGCCVIS